MNNKGFSLVELIIVIAIMAILAGALAPALLRYIEKTRVSNDKSTAANLRTAVEAALADEDVMTAVANAAVKGDTGSTQNWLFITVTPASGSGASITPAAYSANCPASLKAEIDQTIAPKKLKVKSKKDLQQAYYIAIALGETGEADVVEVYLQETAGDYVDTQGNKLSAAPARSNLI